MSRDPFRRVRKPCCCIYDCGRMVQTLEYVREPVSRACQRRAANLRKGPEALRRRRLQRLQGQP